MMRLMCKDCAAIFAIDEDDREAHRRKLSQDVWCPCCCGTVHEEIPRVAVDAPKHPEKFSLGLTRMPGALHVDDDAGSFTLCSFILPATGERPKTV